MDGQVEIEKENVIKMNNFPCVIWTSWFLSGKSNLGLFFRMDKLR